MIDIPNATIQEVIAEIRRLMTAPIPTDQIDYWRNLHVNLSVRDTLRGGPPTVIELQVLDPIERLEVKARTALCSILDCEKKGIFILQVQGAGTTTIRACIDHWTKLQFNVETGRIQWFRHEMAMPANMAQMKKFLESRTAPIPL